MSGESGLLDAALLLISDPFFLFLPDLPVRGDDSLELFSNYLDLATAMGLSLIPASALGPEKKFLY